MPQTATLTLDHLTHCQRDILEYYVRWYCVDEGLGSREKLLHIIDTYTHQTRIASVNSLIEKRLLHSDGQRPTQLGKSLFPGLMRNQVFID